MPEEEKLFKFIAGKFESEYRNVSQGPMMSCPGIRYKNKVFAFYYKDKMVFKLGKDFNPEQYGVTEYSLLNPFKNKAPMKAWFEIPFKESANWEKLTLFALNQIKKEV